MHQGTMSVGNLGNFGNGLERSGFVVGMHDADQRRLVIDSCLDIPWPHTPRGINWEGGHTKAMQAHKLATGSEHSGVFGHLRDEMLTVRLPCQSRTTNGKSIALGPSSGEDDFSRSTGKQSGNLLPGRLDSCVGYVRIEVRAGRIAKVDRQIRQHGFDNSWVNWRCPIVVEIDRTMLQSRMGENFSHDISSFGCVTS